MILKGVTSKLLLPILLLLRWVSDRETLLPRLQNRKPNDLTSFLHLFDSDGIGESRWVASSFRLDWAAALATFLSRTLIPPEFNSNLTWTNHQIVDDWLIRKSLKAATSERTQREEDHAFSASRPPALLTLVFSLPFCSFRLGTHIGQGQYYVKIQQTKDRTK